MIYLILIFSLFPGIAHATDDMFFPTILSTERLMFFSFIFIVALEAWIFYKRLPGLSVRQYIYTAIRANLVTMFIVVPVVWGICFYVLTACPNFLMPLLHFDFSASLLLTSLAIDTNSLLRAEWFMAPLYFIASYYVEYFFCYDTFAKFKPSAIKKAFLLANLASYLMITIFETIYLTFNSPIEFKFW